MVRFAKWQRGIRQWWVGVELQVASVAIPASWALGVGAFGDGGLRLGVGCYRWFWAGRQNTILVGLGLDGGLAGRREWAYGDGGLRAASVGLEVGVGIRC